MDPKKKKSDYNKKYREKQKEKRKNKEKKEIKVEKTEGKKEITSDLSEVNNEEIIDDKSEVNNEEIDKYIDQLVEERLKEISQPKVTCNSVGGLKSIIANHSGLLFPLLLPLVTGTIRIVTKYIPLYLEQQKVQTNTSNHASGQSTLNIEQQLLSLHSQ